MAKYNTIKELADAFNSGELSKDYWMLVVDNDSDWLRYIGESEVDEDGSMAYEFEVKMSDKADELYAGGNGQCDMVLACRAAGIPTEKC